MESKGGSDEDYDRTNSIACPERSGGKKGYYTCTSITKKGGESYIGCGCLYQYKANDDENILESKFLKF